MERCAEAIRETLLAGYRSIHPETGFPAFAFRLHQFMSRGDTVHASLEPAGERHVTVFPQKYVPGDRDRVLLPLVFCRECGQEYYCVRMTHGAGDVRQFAPRELSDRLSDDQSEAGFLYWSAEHPWPSEPVAELDRLPDDWIEQHRGIERVRRARRDWLPRAVRVATNGHEAGGGLDCHYLQAPFRFCLHCGIAYYWRIRSDFGKLTSLATEGRSTATTVLALSAMRHLRGESFLEKRARKLLSFTDNRQDASLQAGHFNDFVEIGILRGALYRALETAADRGLEHDELTQKVFTALDLARDLYASDPEVKFQGRKDTDRAFRDVIGYRLYRDQQRGWRITSPNLEQCGLVEVEYQSLDELCEDVDIWQACHEEENQEEVCKPKAHSRARQEAVRAFAEIERGRGARLDLARAKLYGLILSDVDLRDADLAGADLAGIDLGGANLSNVNLDGANLRDANLANVNLHGANLRGADLRGAGMNNVSLLSANLTAANLTGAYLGGANLANANLMYARLIDTSLDGADLRGANLRGVNPKGADLKGADLRNAQDFIQQRINYTTGSMDTRLPNNLQRPEHWHLTYEEQREYLGLPAIVGDSGIGTPDLPITFLGDPVH